MQQEFIIALTIVLAIALAHMLLARRASTDTLENANAFKPDPQHQDWTAEATRLQPHAISVHEPLIRFYDQEVRTRNSSETRRSAAPREMSFLIRQAEGSHFECYVIRSSR